MTPQQISDTLQYLHYQQRLSAGEALAVLSMPFTSDAEQGRVRGIVLELLLGTAIAIRSPRTFTIS